MWLQYRYYIVLLIYFYLIHPVIKKRYRIVENICLVNDALFAKNDLPFSHLINNIHVYNQITKHIFANTIQSYEYNSTRKYFFVKLFAVVSY